WESDFVAGGGSCARVGKAGNTRGSAGADATGVFLSPRGASASTPTSVTNARPAPTPPAIQTWGVSHVLAPVVFGVPGTPGSPIGTAIKRGSRAGCEPGGVPIGTATRRVGPRGSSTSEYSSSGCSGWLTISVPARGMPGGVGAAAGEPSRLGTTIVPLRGVG